jgi:hypothetical protein
MGINVKKKLEVSEVVVDNQVGSDIIRAFGALNEAWHIRCYLPYQQEGRRQEIICEEPGCGH